MEKYEVVRNLGKGAGGRVFLATEKGSGRHVAIKEIILDPKKKNRTKEAVLKEASILAHLKHPHVVSLQESFFDSSEEQLFIVQDFCDGGTLQDQIVTARQKSSPFSEDQIMQWFVQMTMALHHIHSKKVLHRDLKSQNVFLTKKGVIKIGDFGIAKMMENTFDMAQTCCGTPCYLSPELCQDMPYSSKADVWALGCLLLEMCALRYAFDATNFVSLFYKIVKVDHAEVPPQYSSSLAELIKQLLAKSPDDRPSAGTVLNLAFVQEHLASFIKEKENLQEALHAKQLLKTTVGNGNKSPHRPLSAGGIKSPDENSGTARVRCKSAQPMNRRQHQVAEDEKQLLKTTGRNGNKSPHRPLSAGGIKSPDENSGTARVRCKSAQPMNRRQHQVTEDEKQLLKTTVGNGNKSPHRPLSAGGIKSPDENSGTARVRCKSAQPMNRRQHQVTEDEKQLLKTTVGNGDKSPHRPLSAGGIKSPDENSGTARVRCKSAQPMNRRQHQVTEDEKQLLKTTVGNGNKSPHRPLSAGGIKSPDENSGTARVRCKSAQPMNRRQHQVTEDEKQLLKTTVGNGYKSSHRPLSAGGIKSPDENSGTARVRCKSAQPMNRRQHQVTEDEKQLLKTTVGNGNKSPHRPLSAGGIKSPDENSGTARVRCKSAQPMNRGQQQVAEDEKKEVDQTKQVDDPGEYLDDFDDSDDEEYSDEFDEDSELNGDSAKKPMCASKLKENRDGEEPDEEYPDDFEDDSDEEVLDDILTNARAAQDAEVEEELVEDSDRPSSCKQKLKEQVINVIGEKMFEEVRERFARGEMDGEQRPEFERLGGSELMETCYLVNELFIGPEGKI